MADKKQGAVSLLLIIIVGLLIIVSGYYFLKPSNKNQETDKIINKTAEQVKKDENKTSNEEEYENWQEYINEKYNYKIKYPTNWYFVKEGYSPPPPTTVLFSNQDKNYAQGADYIFVEISMDLKLDRTLETIGEVISLKEQGYESENIKLAEADAIYLFNNKDLERGKVDSTYFIKEEYIYRINYGGDTKETKENNKKIFQEILKTFNFLN